MPKTILVVDDDTAMHQLLTHILRRSGYQVNCASDGAQALEMIAADPPDLVLCDIFMPYMDGYAVLASLRDTPDFKTLPVIMISTCGDMRSRERAQTLGANGFITKPFLPHMITDAVDEQL
ncbi:MAG: response regulator [Anaerolineae bacterium]|nr:response regulator [Anaerolineae bacterium]